MSEAETQTDHVPVSERFPQLAQLDQQQPDQQIETFRHVLDELQRDLDDGRDDGRD